MGKDIRGMQIRFWEIIPRRSMPTANQNAGSGDVATPIWFPAAVLFSTGILLIPRWRRRSRTGLCPTCNYNLSGLPPNSPCPECGRAAGKKGA